MSALCSISPQAEVLPDVHSCESGDTQFFGDFTRSFTTGVFFLKQANCQLRGSPGHFLTASLVLVVREKSFGPPGSKARCHTTRQQLKTYRLCALATCRVSGDARSRSHRPIFQLGRVSKRGVPAAPARPAEAAAGTAAPRTGTAPGRPRPPVPARSWARPDPRPPAPGPGPAPLPARGGQKTPARLTAQLYLHLR